MKRTVIALVVGMGICIALCGALYFGFKSWDLSRQLRHVPIDFGVSKVIWSAEDSWGAGPGGNETGVIVYELEAAQVEKILRGGVTYLNSMPQQPGDSRDWYGRYGEWGSTPVLLEGDDGTPRRTQDHEIAHYLDRYGFGIPLDPKIEQEINAALSNAGSYFAYGRIGFILVMPKSNRVVYAYNG